MIVYDLTGGEDNPHYQSLQLDNLIRQYDFLRSIIATAVGLNHQRVTDSVLHALNYHAIACLHSEAGEYRTVPVVVARNGNVEYSPPDHSAVPGLMRDFIANVNDAWDSWDEIVLASYCLWRLNYIHPFVNGNGRTARALCYYVLCVSLGGPLPGSPILPDLIRQNHDEYVRALRVVDADQSWGGLSVLCGFVGRLMEQQLRSA